MIYGVRLLEALGELGVESHLVMSPAAKLTLGHETGLTPREVEAKAHASWPHGALDAPLASGSFRTEGMIVAPCSVKSAAAIATGVTTNLLTRAADVTLKERRKLVLLVRETPLHLGHLRTLGTLAELGAIVAPPMVAFYNRPETLDQVIDHTVGRALDLFGLDTDRVRRWGQDSGGAEITKRKPT